MSNSFKNKNLNTEILDWNIIQSEMKTKLGSEIYESWLKKIEFVEEFNNYLSRQEYEKSYLLSYLVYLLSHDLPQEFQRIQ